ncbi:T9SS type A sorting domain-containing protein [candidate division KSB1 bacterium]|nr:T9SS type A sorting domain-containing protein [candidate division KSB1 bacterium]
MRMVLGWLLLAVTPVIAADLKITWQPNREPDLAGYFVYYAVQTGFYNYRLAAGLQTEYTIRNLKPGATYFIAVTAVDTAGNESAFSEQVRVSIPAAAGGTNTLPERHQLLPSFPNPFETPKYDKTTFSFELHEPTRAKLQIFDVLGNLVVTLINGERQAGTQKVSWNGYDRQGLPVRTGIYFYRLQTAGQTINRKLVVYR